MTERNDSNDMARTTALASSAGPIPERTRMNAMNILRRTLNVVFLSLLASLVSLPVFGVDANTHQAAPGGVQSVNIIQTSFVPRVITNIVEMRVPTNVFITVYRTNQFEARRTNVFDVYQTNWVRTTRTNVVPVELMQTNLITRYETNVNTLTLTNWQTVLVFKTNRITQPITNLVQIDVPADQTASAPSAADVESKGDTATAIAAPTTVSTGGLILEATRTAKPSANGQAEISLKLKLAGNEAPTFLSQEWQVERTDRSVLLFGRGPEFKRELPLGTYKVEVKTRSAEDSPVVRVRGNFEVTRDEVIQQKPARLVNAR